MLRGFCNMLSIIIGGLLKSWLMLVTPRPFVKEQTGVTLTCLSIRADVNANRWEADQPIMTNFALGGSTFAAVSSSPPKYPTTTPRESRIDSIVLARSLDYYAGESGWSRPTAIRALLLSYKAPLLIRHSRAGGNPSILGQMINQLLLDSRLRGNDGNLKVPYRHHATGVFQLDCRFFLHFAERRYAGPFAAVDYPGSLLTDLGYFIS